MCDVARWHGRWTPYAYPTHTPRATHPGGAVAGPGSALSTAPRGRAGVRRDGARSRMLAMSMAMRRSAGCPCRTRYRREARRALITLPVYSHVHALVHNARLGSGSPSFAWSARRDCDLHMCRVGVASMSRRFRHVVSARFRVPHASPAHRAPRHRQCLRTRSAIRCPWLPVPTLVPYRCPETRHR